MYSFNIHITFYFHFKIPLSHRTILGRITKRQIHYGANPYSFTAEVNTHLWIFLKPHSNANITRKYSSHVCLLPGKLLVDAAKLCVICCFSFLDLKPHFVIYIFSGFLCPCVVCFISKLGSASRSFSNDKDSMLSLASPYKVNTFTWSGKKLTGIMIRLGSVYFLFDKYIGLIFVILKICFT